jgi:hypothetical protein
LVVDDPRRLDLPQRRLLGIVLARLAGGVDTALEHRVGAGAAIGARRGEAGLVDRLQAQRIDEAVAVVLAELNDLAIGDLAIGLGQPGIALGAQPLGLLVIDDLVGFDRGAVVIDLDVADRRDPLVVVVVVDLVRLDEHRPLLLLGQVAARGRLGSQLTLTGQERRLRRGRNGLQRSENRCEKRANNRAGNLRSGWASVWTAEGSGGRTGHHPSS